MANTQQRANKLTYCPLEEQTRSISSYRADVRQTRDARILRLEIVHARRERSVFVVLWWKMDISSAGLLETALAQRFPTDLDLLVLCGNLALHHFRKAKSLQVHSVQEPPPRAQTIPALFLTVGCENSGKGRKLTSSPREKVLHPSKIVWLRRRFRCRDCNRCASANLRTAGTMALRM